MMEKLLDIQKSTKEEIEEALLNRQGINTGDKRPGVVTMLNWMSGPDFAEYMGYTVHTDKRKIVCIIYDESNCCENWDAEYKKENIPHEEILMDNIDPICLDCEKNMPTNCEECEKCYQKFIAENKEGIKITLNVDDVDGDYDEGSAVELVIIQEDIKHTIKLWNEHNGYYAHDYIIYDTSGELTTNGLI